MTIMSVSAPRINSGFSIQSILGDIDNKQNSENSENKGSKRKNSEDESDECNTCCLNHTESGRIDTPNSRLHFGTFDGLANGNILRKLHYAHYGHYLSHEYMSRTQEDFRNFWHTGSEDGSNPFYLPLSLRHNYQPRAQATNPDFIFSHLRKPKRVRTAFSPSQLLRLEHAFEKNHYVVGQERKELAAGLALTETQVKVWFQNRRTKHKRIKAEDEMTRSLARSLDERDTNEHEQYNSSDDESDIEV